MQQHSNAIAPHRLCIPKVSVSTQIKDQPNVPPSQGDNQDGYSVNEAEVAATFAIPEEASAPRKNKAQDAVVRKGAQAGVRQKGAMA